jgi:hypothetical protein
MGFFEVAILVGAAASFLYRTFGYSPPKTKLKKSIKQIPKNEIQNTPGNKIAKLVGEVVQLSEPLIAPLTGIPCVCYESVVEEFREEDNEKRWVMLAQDTHRQNFLLRQGTESAVIKVRYAEMHLVEFRPDTSSVTSAPPRVQSFLEKRGEFSVGRRRRIRYKEGVLEVGKKVMVCGFATREVDLQAESSGYRDQGTRLVFEHQEENNLYISNDPSSFS